MVEIRTEMAMGMEKFRAHSLPRQKVTDLLQDLHIFENSLVVVEHSFAENDDRTGREGLVERFQK